MISGKAVELLKTFSEEEFKKFGLFLSSPFYNTEKKLVSFYNAIKKHYPFFAGRGFSKDRIFSKLYPGKKYNDTRMRNILSGILEQAQKFLAVSGVQKDSFNMNTALLKELSRRKQEKLFEKKEQLAEKELEKEKIKDENHYNRKFILGDVKRMNKFNRGSSLLIGGDTLTKMFDNLEIHFLMSMMRTGTYAANTARNMFGYTYNPGLIEELEKYLNKEAEKYKDIIYINYYYNSFKLARTEDEKHFYALRDIINEDYEHLNDADKMNIFTVLTNYCYFKTSHGELKFAGEHFSLYKENVERGYYRGMLEFMTHLHYMNVVVTGLEAGEVEWVEKFIEQYKSELDEKNRENTYCFCKSLLHYHKKEYDNALREASRVKTDDLSYKHQLKSLYLKIYFDLNDWETFLAHIDSYKHFIVSDKNVPAETRNVINNYINFSKKLFDIKNNSKEMDFEFSRLKKEVIENKAMINKPWLLKKIDELQVLSD